MYKYDEEHNTLVFFQVDNPDMGDRFNLLKDIKEAYRRFETEGVLEVCEEINEHIEETPNRFTFFTTKVAGYRNEPDHVAVKARIVGDSFKPPIDVLELPYMDDLGKLHFKDRSVKSVVNKVVSADDISYDVDNDTLSIVMSKKIIKIMCNAKAQDIQVIGRNKSKISMATLIVYISLLEGNVKDVKDLIRNPLLLSTMPQAAKRTTGIPIDLIVSSDSTGLIDNLRNNPDYEVGNLRNSINSAVTIDRALGETLSRPVAGYPAGTYITPSIIRDLKKHRVDRFYVENITPFPAKKLDSGLDGYPLVFTRIPAGTENTPFLQDLLPEYADISVLEEEIILIKSDSSAEGILDFTGKPATEDNLRFLRSIGCKGVRIKAGDSYKECPFELEIISNGAYRYEDLYTHAECQSMGVKPTDWCAGDSDKLTSDDLLAIYSTLGFMVLKGTNLFMDRDRDFLKKVELVDVAMRKALYDAIILHTRRYRVNITGYLKGSAREEGCLSGLTIGLRKCLNDAGYIETPDTTNLVAEISQATHITNTVKEAPEIMRQIALPYYGRICPFETPEGKKVGLVNSKAIGCHIVNGDMYVPVRKVIKEGDRIRISDTIEEVSVRDELSLRITDVLQLKPSREAPYYENTRVIAKVPNPDPVGERLVYANIYASDLDYVYAHTEAFLSAATSMVPCASSNDAVRVSFGTKMIKSAIYIMDPDKPVVQTAMYRDIFNSTNAYLIIAERSGTVECVSPDLLTVLYDGDVEETEYRIEEFKVTKDSVVFMRYKVTEGERVRAGQVLVDCTASSDGVYCPGKSELIAYMPSGYNYEDALHVSERTTLDYISITTRSITKPRNKNTTVNKDGLFKYYMQGDVITEITERRNRDSDIKTPVRLDHHEGIWYNVKETKDNNKMVYKFDLLGYSILGKGDKMSGLHGNKGVDALVEKNSCMPMLANGMTIRILPNPHGLPSRMNVGQIKEAHLGLIATVLGVYIRSDSFNGATLEEVQKFMKLANKLANCGDASKCRAICADYDLEEALISQIEKRMPEIMKWANTFDENGDARIWNPVLGEWHVNKVTIGVSTFLKMKQEAEEKIHARGGVLEESYMMTTSQPPKGGQAGGGQALGEMELWALMAYGAAEVVHESWNEKSDNECARVNMELAAIKNPIRVSELYNHPRSVYNFIYQLQSFGLMLEDDDNRLPDTSNYTSKKHYTVSVANIIEDSDTNGSYCEKVSSDVMVEEKVDAIVESVFGTKGE